MHGIKIPQQNFALKMQGPAVGGGGLCVKGGIFAGHYGSIFYDRLRLLDLATCVSLQSTAFLIKRSMKIE